MEDGTLKYYMLDWDDNILKMPTKIIVKTEDGSGTEEVSTSEFQIICDEDQFDVRKVGDERESFVHFDDDADFATDLQKALDDLENTKRPSFEPFRQALIQARLFAIVTARGQSSNAFRSGVETIITHTFSSEEHDRMLENIQGWRRRAGLDLASDPLDYYLGLNAYYGVSGTGFKREFKTELDELGASKDPSDAGPAKTVAVDHFVGETLKRASAFDSVEAAHFGFSDDTEGNVTKMQSYFGGDYARKWDDEYPHIDVVFFTYDTNDWKDNEVLVRRFA